jgi:DNA-binding MarR family transcriptional regulator
VSATPLSPDDTGRALIEVFDVLGPLYRRISRTVEEAEEVNDMSVGVRAVLDRLHRTGEQTVPAMAGALALSRQFVQRCVHDAAGRGWVELRPNPAHQRSSLIALTSDGEAAIRAVATREHSVLREVDGLTAEDVAACLRVLRRIHAFVGRNVGGNADGGT